MRDVILLFRPHKAPDVTFKYSTFDPHCVCVSVCVGGAGASG